MSMITELIERLRNTADKFEKSGWGVDGLIKDYREAAFVIEELSEKLKAVNRDDAPFDGMTNGEVIDLLFPGADIYHNRDFTLREMIFPDEWWDAPYKAESEEK